MGYKLAGEFHTALDEVIPDNTITGVSTIGHTNPFVILVDTNRELTSGELTEAKRIIES